MNPPSPIEYLLCFTCLIQGHLIDVDLHAYGDAYGLVYCTRCGDGYTARSLFSLTGILL